MSDEDLLLPLLTTGEVAASPTSATATTTIDTNLLAQLPALLSPAEAASWLGMSTETIRRHTRQGKLPVVKVLGVTRIPATSATALVRAKVVSRLPARYRKPLRDQDV